MLKRFIVYRADVQQDYIYDFLMPLRLLSSICIDYLLTLNSIKEALKGVICST